MVDWETQWFYRVHAVSAGAEAAGHAGGDIGNAVARAHGVPLIWRTEAVSVAIREEHFYIMRNARRPAGKRIACAFFFVCLLTNRCIHVLCIYFNDECSISLCINTLLHYITLHYTVTTLQHY